MIPALPTPGLYDVKIKRANSDVYWASKVAVTKQADNINDLVTSDWTTSSIIIPSGEVISIYVTGFTNPPTNLPLTDIKIWIGGKYSLTSPLVFKMREERLSVLSTGLSTCAYESEEASVHAIVGLDRISKALAKYRFRFRTFNIHPSKSGFQVTMPSTYIGAAWVAASSYKITCLKGCGTAAAVTPVIASNVITFNDVFTDNIAAGTLIDLVIEGWTNPSTETIYDVSFATIWEKDCSGNKCIIDKFSNLAIVSTSPSTALTSAWASTRVIITDATKRATLPDCRIMPPQLSITPRTIGVSGAVAVETAGTDAKFAP